MVAMMLAGSLLLGLDLLAKNSAEALGEGRSVQVGRVAQIRHVSNRRRIYALRPVRVALVLTWVLAIIAAALLAANGPFNSTLSRIGLGAALGGAAGNLFDIVSTHSVRDYIDLGWWPVFNLADVAIIGGLALAFLER